MSKIAFKCVDGLIYTASLINFSQTDRFVVKNMKTVNGNINLEIPNMKSAGSYYMGETTVYKDKLIWYYIEE